MQRKILETLLFHEDFCEPPYIVHQENYRKYRKLLIELYTLKAQGLCDFTYDKLSKPLILHCVNITWTSECDSIDIDASILSSICSLVDGILIDQDLKTWQLSTTIYEEV